MADIVVPKHSEPVRQDSRTHGTPMQPTSPRCARVSAKGSLAPLRVLRSVCALCCQAAAVLSERVDEGRWESEGGQPVHKSTSEQSIEGAAADSAKADKASTAVPATAAADASASTAPAAATASFDATKLHPTTIEGKPGDSAASHYDPSATAADQPASAATEPSAAAAATTAASSSSDAPNDASLDVPTQPPRKKSISERLAETWQDIKHKVEDLTHKKKGAEGGGE